MTNKINGIDVSECDFYEEIRELPDNLNGGYYIQHCYCGLQGDNYCICNKNPDCYFKQLKRLQEENEGLKSLNDFNVQKIEVLQKENEKLKADLKGETEQCQKWYQLETDKHFQMLKYEQALEEIRKKITPVCADCNNIDGFTTWDDCENVCEKGVIKYLKIIDEVLNDRD